MIKIRIVFFTITLIIVGVLGVFATYYARGYRFNLKTLRFQPNGILVLKSEPDGASVYINGELETATNANISIAPGVYDVEVKKDGYLTWSKRLTIEKEIVTQATVSLFKNAPSLTPTTLSGATNVVMSKDGSKIVYSVLPSKNLDDDKVGLWILDTFSLPLGFNSDPKRIADGNMTDAIYEFSPDTRQILLTISDAVFLIDTGSFTSQDRMVNVASTKDEVLAEWVETEKSNDEALIKNLPPPLNDILARKTHAFIFSPDDNMVAYTASASATLPENLIKQLPGASTQTQHRNIEAGATYVYDIKEDRNFLISRDPVTIDNNDKPETPALRWMSTSRHLLWAGDNQAVIMDYDGTNRQVIYSGSYVKPDVFPFSNTTRLLILTNLGSVDSVPNLYNLTVK